MNFQTIADGLGAMTSVISVEPLKDGQYGEIRIVAANAAFVDSIEHPPKEMHLEGVPFKPGGLYSDFVPSDLNFELYCYEAAVNRKCMHAYVQPKHFDFWFNTSFLPVEAEEDGLCYCTYTMELNPVQEAAKMANISGEISRKVLETCIKIRGAADFRAAMDEVIQDMQQLCDARRCCILLMDQQTRNIEVLCEAQAESLNLPKIADVIEPAFYHIVETWEATIAGSSCLIVRNAQDMEVVRERNPKWHSSLTRGGVRSMILFPIWSQGTLLGYMWATNFDEQRASEIKETLELTTFILGSEIANYKMLEKLKDLSTRDMLTGVMNRNQMNNYVEQLSRGEVGEGSSVGVIFADLNDLKTINDVEGHAAGDEVLKTAACLLKEVFEETKIYRAGGDEFTVILTGITQDELARMVAKIQEADERNDRVCFAVGFDVEEDVRDVRKALTKADENMYEDKKKFYDLHPEKRRTPGLSCSA